MRRVTLNAGTGNELSFVYEVSPRLAAPLNIPKNLSFAALARSWKVGHQPFIVNGHVLPLCLSEITLGTKLMPKSYKNML
jgi:hypothetical protein